MLIRTEHTPNSSTLKFLPGQPVMESGTRDFADAESAEASPLRSAERQSSSAPASVATYQGLPPK